MIGLCFILTFTFEPIPELPGIHCPNGTTSFIGKTVGFDISAGGWSYFRTSVMKREVPISFEMTANSRKSRETDAVSAQALPIYRGKILFLQPNTNTFLSIPPMQLAISPANKFTQSLFRASQNHSIHFGYFHDNFSSPLELARISTQPSFSRLPSKDGTNRWH
jgi:hypothetical protein